MKMQAWLGILVVVLLSACAPYKQELVCEVKANETAFLINVEQGGTNNQAKIKSVKFLEDSKVAAQRVVIQQRDRSNGYGWGAVEYVPLSVCIKVNRTPETREWVSDDDKGGNNVKKIQVESRESIGFSVGVNITAVVREEDAATYLYNYPASTPENDPGAGADRIAQLRASAILKGRPLAETIDTEIRGFVTGELSREFGERSLFQGQQEKAKIFAIVKANTVNHFKKQGITITNLALSEGLTYENPQIQQSIDEEFKASTLKRVEEQKRQAQAIANQTDLLKAQGARKIAEEAARNKAAQLAQLDIELRRNASQAELIRAQADQTRADALKLSAEKGQPIVPTVVSNSAGWVYGVGAQPPITKTPTK